MASVSGSEEMASLQSLATRALHAAVVSSGRDVPIVRRILFASRLQDKPEPDQTLSADSSEKKKDLQTNTLESLCRGVVHKSVTYNGRWKVQFNKVVAKTHVDVLSDDPDLIHAEDSIVNDVRMEAADFLVNLPAILDSTTKSKDHKAHRFLAREGRGVSSAQLGRSARNLERLNGSAAAAASFSAPPGGISPALLRGHCTKGRKSENRMPPSEHLAPFAE
mmetsp:Transcript_23996/g.48990  ORF Transcript_23996/g.48990 Transcript_23996/m.48990 type:complete len:221 (+) Transcript_23996:143-805(+)